MKKSRIFFVLFFLIILVACQKAVDEEPNAINQTGLPRQELTEAEQDFITEVEGRAETRRLKGVDMLKLLRILVKAEPSEIECYKEFFKTHEEIEKAYGRSINSAFTELIFKKDKRNHKQVSELALEIIRTKRDHPIAVAHAVDALGYIGDPSVIPLLRELSKETNIGIKYSAVSSLLALGDIDTALPLIDKAAKDGHVFGVDALFPRGKLIDERGKDILVKALSYPGPEVAASAAEHLYDMGLHREKCEEVALNVLKRLMHKKQRDYGFEIVNPSDPRWVVLPEYKSKKFDDLFVYYFSDHRACLSAVSLLGKIRSKRAVPLLKYIKENNTTAGFVCQDTNVESALSKIEGDGK